MTSSDQPLPLMYRHRDADEALLYIGLSDEAAFRIRHHHHMRDARWWRFVARIDVDLLTDRHIAYRQELDAITRERPIFNRKGCDEDQPAREEEYWLTHPGVAAWWFNDRTPRDSRTRPEFLPSMSRGQLDATLRQLGAGEYLLPRAA